MPNICGVIKAMYVQRKFEMNREENSICVDKHYNIFNFLFTRLYIYNLDNYGEIKIKYVIRRINKIDRTLSSLLNEDKRALTERILRQKYLDYPVHFYLENTLFDGII